MEYKNFKNGTWELKDKFAHGDRNGGSFFCATEASSSSGSAESTGAHV